MKAAPRSPWEVFKAFLFMGATSFGGPAAGLGSLEAEFARRREWVTPEKARELLTWAKLLPGPVVTQFAILLGRETGGASNGIAAGMGFVIPAILLVGILSVLGEAGGQSPVFRAAFEGGILGALAVVAVSVVDLSRGQLSDRWRWMAFFAAGVMAALFPRVEPLLIFGGGLWSAWRTSETGAAPDDGEGTTQIPTGFWLFTIAFTSLLFLPPSLVSTKVPQIFQICLRAAAMTFGTGMAVLPVLRSEFIDHHQWLTTAQFSLGLALGQVTPGPMVITAAALGFAVARWPGFAAGALGIFLPSFLNALLFIPAVKLRIRSPQRMAAFVSGAFPWVLGALAAAGLVLGAQILRGEGETAFFTPAFWVRAGVFLVLFGGIIRFRPPSWAVIVGMGLLSLTRFFF